MFRKNFSDKAGVRLRSVADTAASVNLEHALFKIDIGPSCSHTVGPMRVALIFAPFPLKFGRTDHTASSRDAPHRCQRKLLKKIEN